jgi:lysine 6-dehydrogenase
MRKFDFLVLGASGMQGEIVARDLLERGYSVLLTDVLKNGSGEMIIKYPKAEFRYSDNRKLRKLIKLIKKSGADVVINCAESDWNLNVYRACLAARINVVDLDSDIVTTEKQLAMFPLFEKRKLTAITGCGSTPGINNIMLNYASKQFDSIETLNLGFSWNSSMEKFVMPFSMHSIAWEFTKPASVVENGEMKTRPPLSMSIETNFKLIGRQTAYLVEHTEIFTFFHYFKEKGLKNVHFYAGFPKHSFNVISSLVEAGLASWQKVQLENKIKVTPLDVVTEVARKIEFPDSYTESENIWIEIIGKRDGEVKRVIMECAVPPLKGWEDHGCNVDTGMPASIIAQMIKDGRISTRGSFAPEAIVPEEEFFKELWNRGMIVYQNNIPINGIIIEEPARHRKSKNDRVHLETKAVA